MPSIITHYIFNNSLLDEENFSFLKNNLDIYFLAAQGPDPLFFLSIIPSKRKNKDLKAKKYGTFLHKKSPHFYFEKSFIYANKSQYKDILYSYIYGYGLHYILDKIVHPYIFYRTYSTDKENFYFHTVFENNLDIVLSNYFLKRKASYKYICSDINKVKIISEMYKNNSDIIDNQNIDNTSFVNAYKDMLKIEKFLYSKYGLKKMIFSLFFKKSSLNSMSHCNKIKDDHKIDYLNISHKEWENPGSGIKSKDSVIQLFDKAKQEAIKWFKIVNDAYNENITTEEIESFCDNYNFEGIKEDEFIKYYKCVYK